VVRSTSEQFSADVDRTTLYPPLPRRGVDFIPLAQELDTGEIVTLDADFQTYRWKKNKPFQSLIRS